MSKVIIIKTTELTRASLEQTNNLWEPHIPEVIKTNMQHLQGQHCSETPSMYLFIPVPSKLQVLSRIYIIYYIDIGHTFGFNTNERFATKQWEIITL